MAKPISIGDGFFLTKTGMDTNGNFCVWIKLAWHNIRARKIQTNGSCPAAHHKTIDEILQSEDAKSELKNYYNTYMLVRRS